MAAFTSCDQRLGSLVVAWLLWPQRGHAQMIGHGYRALAHNAAGHVLHVIARVARAGHAVHAGAVAFCRVCCHACADSAVSRIAKLIATVTLR